MIAGSIGWHALGLVGRMLRGEGYDEGLVFPFRILEQCLLENAGSGETDFSCSAVRGAVVIRSPKAGWTLLN